MARLAFATWRAQPEMTADDQLVIEPLRDRGIDVESIPWSSTAAEWTQFDAVVLRSCWDYHVRVRAFLDWLEKLEAADVRVVNPVPIVRWNLDKRYLEELGQPMRMNANCSVSLPCPSSCMNSPMPMILSVSTFSVPQMSTRLRASWSNKRLYLTSAKPLMMAGTITPGSASRNGITHLPKCSLSAGLQINIRRFASGDRVLNSA